MKKTVVLCLAILNTARKRINSIIQSKEAKAFAHRVKTEAGKDAQRLAGELKRKALQGIAEAEHGLKKARYLLTKRKK